MDSITATELRTKSKQLIRTLKKGKAVDFIYRSKVVGRFRPVLESKPFDPEKFIKIAKRLNLPSLSREQEEANYREHLEKKYGKSISRYQRVHRPVAIAK